MTITGVVIVFAVAFIGPGILRNSRSQPCPSGALLILASGPKFCRCAENLNRVLQCCSSTGPRLGRPGVHVRTSVVPARYAAPMQGPAQQTSSIFGEPGECLGASRSASSIKHGPVWLVRTRRLMNVGNCIVVLVRPHYRTQPGCTNYASQLAHARTHTGQTFQWQSCVHRTTSATYLHVSSCARIWGPTQRTLPDSDLAAGGCSLVIAGRGRRLCVA